MVLDCCDCSKGLQFRRIIIQSILVQSCQDYCCRYIHVVSLLLWQKYAQIFPPILSMKNPASLLHGVGWPGNEAGKSQTAELYPPQTDWEVSCGQICVLYWSSLKLGWVAECHPVCEFWERWVVSPRNDVRKLVIGVLSTEGLDVHGVVIAFPACCVDIGVTHVFSIQTCRTSYSLVNFPLVAWKTNSGLQLALLCISKFNELPHQCFTRFYELFTDGSKECMKTSSFVVCYDSTSSFWILDRASILTAELHAIKLALDIARRTRKKQYVIYSDSMSALQAISHSDLNNQPVLEIITEYTRLIKMDTAGFLVM